MGVELSLQRLQANLKTSARMPLVFLGHGSPMNAIEDTAFSRSWTELGRILPRPQAILVVSAHWMTRGTTLVDVSPRPRIIHDFYGFPDALYAQQYPAQGDPELAAEVVTLLAEHRAQGTTVGGWIMAPGHCLNFYILRPTCRCSNCRLTCRNHCVGIWISARHCHRCVIAAC